jgi:hypothetical protein
MSIRTLVLVALTSMLVTGGVARAQDSGPEHVTAQQDATAQDATAQQDATVHDATAQEIIGSVVRNIRRSLALGPTFSAFSVYAPSGSELEGGLAFGLELELFRSGLPTPASIRELVRKKAQEKLLLIIRDQFAGQRPDAATMQRLVREIAAEVKAEVIAGLGAKPRLLERPRLGILIETNYFFDSADWLGRLGFALGVGPLSLGPSFSVRFGDDTVARLGAELSIHLLPTKSPRSPVLDIFLRSDFELHARDANDDQVSLGVRVLLDII